MESMGITTSAVNYIEQNATDRSADAYLPVNRDSANRFINDFEGFVLGCLRRMRIENEEDVLFCVFERALNGLVRFRGESSLKTWLYRITMHEGMRHLSKRSRINEIESAFTVEALHANSDGNVEDLLERTDTANRVKTALNKLKAIDREILYLRFFLDLKIVEIAERMEIPLNTAKVRLHRALQHLKTHLEEIVDEQ